MTRRRYKSYKKRSPRRQSRGRGGNKISLRWVIFLLLIIFAGVFTMKYVGKTQEEKVVEEDPIVTLDRLLGKPDTQGDKGDALPVVKAKDPVPAKEVLDVLPPDGGGVSSEAAKVLIDAANKDYEIGKIIAARDKLNRALTEMRLNKKDRDDVKGWLTKLSDEWLFGPSVFEGDSLTGNYEVVGGDLLSIIGNKFKVPHEILMDINGIKDAGKLKLGKMKIVNGPFHVKVQLSKFNMDLYLQDQYVKSYKIGIGKPGEETPTGKWRLRPGGKLDNGPSWLNKETGKMIVASDPEYPLGARWIPIECLEGNGVGETGIALHGTNDPESIGTRCSLGCIRMRDEDVIEVYKMLSSGISNVEIVD